MVAVLAGASDNRQVASQVADLPQSLLAKLDASWNWFQGRYDWPIEPTLRRVLQSIDAGQLNLLIGSWLFERAHRDTDGLLVIAVDGKVLRGAWTADNGETRYRTFWGRRTVDSVELGARSQCPRTAGGR